MNQGFKAEIFREGLQLLIAVDGGKANELFPEAETLFMVKDFPAKVEFTPSTNEGNMGIVLSMGSDRFEGVKE